MRHLQLARWLMPALLLSALPLLSYAGAFHRVGFAGHMMPASGQPQTQTDATAGAQPQAPAKTPANRKHLNVSVGPVRMHIPVSGKRPVAANGPANGNTATGTPDLVHPVQQPLGTPSQRQEPLANGNAPDSGSGPADVRVETTGTSAQKARSTQEVQTPAGGGGKSGSENLPILMQPANGSDERAYQPPQPIAPATETLIREVDAHSPITFRWTPVIPKPQDPVTYRLSVWQLMVGQTGAQAMKANTPIITRDVDDMTQAEISNLVTGPCLPPYLCDFVWTVQALDRKDRPIGGDNGVISSAGFRFEPQNQQAYQPPQAIAPANSRSFRETDEKPQPQGNERLADAGSTPARPQPSETWIMSWTTDAMTAKGKEKPQGPVTYRVQVWEILPGQDSAQAMKANRPILTKLADEPSLDVSPGIVTGPCLPPYLCDYVWNVQALNRDGKPIGENHGFSETASFNYDSRGKTFVERQPGGKNESRKNGSYVLGLNLSFDRVQPAGAGGNSNAANAPEQPATEGIYDRWGSPALARQPTPGGSGTGTPAQIDIGIASGGVHRQVTRGAAMKANTPIITKDVDEQPAASGGGAATRSLAAPGSGPVKPQPADNPITAISITLPANPDAAKKVNGTTGGGTGKAQGYMAGVENAHIQADKQAPNQNGKATRQTGSQLDTNTRSVAAPGSGSGKPQPADNPITAISITLPANPDANVKVNGTTVSSGTASSINGNKVVEIHEKQSPEDSATTQPPQPGGSSSGTEIKETGFSYPGGLKTAPGTAQPQTLNQNGKAVPHETVTPVVSRPESRTITTDQLQGPQGAGMQASPTPLAMAAPPANSTPHAKPAKKKSKMSVHVVF